MGEIRRAIFGVTVHIQIGRKKSTQKWIPNLAKNIILKQRAPSKQTPSKCVKSPPLLEGPPQPHFGFSV